MAIYSVVCTRHVEVYEATTLEVEADTITEARDLAEEASAGSGWIALERRVSIGAVIPTLIQPPSAKRA